MAQDLPSTATFAGQEVEEEGLTIFCKRELKAMVGLGWPVCIGMLCRFMMSSMDVAFIGHIGGNGHTSLLKDAMPNFAAAGQNGELMPLMFPAWSLHSAETARRLVGSKEYLAAASLSEMCANLVVIPLLGMGFALNPLVANAMGARNLKMAGIFLQLALFCITLALIPVFVSFFFVGDLLKAFDFDPQICDLAGIYTKFQSIWVLPNAWYITIRFFFQAQGKARPAMYCGMTFVGVNALLLWILVYGGPADGSWWVHGGLGFIGAAVSISCSRVLQFVAYSIYMFILKGDHLPTWPGWSWEFLQKTHLRGYFAQVLPRMCTLLLQFFVSQSIIFFVAELGVLEVAASSAATQAIFPISTCLVATFSALGSIRVGMKLGKGDAFEARRTAWLALAAAAGTVLIIAAFLLPLRHWAMSLMANNPEVQTLGASLLIPMMVNFMGSVLTACGNAILASQGRPRLSTILILVVELPLSFGSILVLVLVFHADVRIVYWVQGLVTALEAAIVCRILARSDWERHARETHAKNQAAKASATSLTAIAKKPDESEQKEKEEEKRENPSAGA